MFTVHGGVLATLMDTAMGSAVFTKLGDCVAYTTLELKGNFIRAVTLDGSRPTCEARGARRAAHGHRRGADRRWTESAARAENDSARAGFTGRSQRQ